jgi:hypothetical protein
LREKMLLVKGGCRWKKECVFGYLKCTGEMIGFIFSALSCKHCVSVLTFHQRLSEGCDISPRESYTY